MADTKKILIVSNFFYPEITPRAMRTTELAREFARAGHSVTVVIPNKKLYHDNPLEDAPDLDILYAEGPVAEEQKAAPARRKFRHFIPVWAQKVILYFWNHEYFAKYDRGIEKTLASLGGNYDMLLSISYPVAIHRAVVKALKKNRNLTAKRKFAEFSDPPMRGEFNKSFFPAYGCFLKKLGKVFDRFIIPVENAKPAYLKYKLEAEISVIPQGFDNSSIRVQNYVPHQRPTFAYAGRFYRNTRDPRPLFEHLTSLDRDFEFVLYLIDNDPYFDAMIEEFRQRVKGEITVKPPVSRDELIYQLSGMDFVLNHSFNYSTATPSKLIDYSLAGRPVFSFSPIEFDTAVFDRFMEGDYVGAIKLPPVEDYDIKTVVDKFLALTERS